MTTPARLAFDRAFEKGCDIGDYSSGWSDPDLAWDSLAADDWTLVRTEEVERLQAALRRFGRHERECHVHMPWDSSCTCGWDALIATLADPVKEEPR